MQIQRILQIVMKVVLILVVVTLALPFAARGGVALWAARHISTVEEVPAKRVGIVFGARVYSSGRPSAMLADRVAAGAALYHAGKVDSLLMTGSAEYLPGPEGVLMTAADGYNEPEAMLRYAASLGVPPEDILLDYGGQRTYDSCYRARTIYGVEEAVLLTQNFHLPRALMTCAALGMDVAGVRADDQRPWGYSRTSLSYSRTREFPATLLAIIDVLRREQPPIMGKPMPVDGGEALD